jgi:hypothetical protein
MKKRTSRATAARSQLTDMQWDHLCGRPLPKNNFEAYVLEYDWNDTTKQLWEQHGATVIAEFVKENPGTRPPLFWEHDAPRLPMGTFPGWFVDGKLPMPRERIGGTGTAAYEVTSVMPSFWYGIPDCWIAIEKGDEPVFESQASYLKRHGLLFDGEERRSDFSPEIISYGNFLSMTPEIAERIRKLAA